MSSNMDTITESGMANFMHNKGGIGVKHRFLTIERNIEEFKACTGQVFVSVGCSTADLERAEALRDAGAVYFCVDVAHAHAKYVGNTLKNLRKLLGDSRCIMQVKCRNVCRGRLSCFVWRRYHQGRYWRRISM